MANNTKIDSLVQASDDVQFGKGNPRIKVAVDAIEYRTGDNTDYIITRGKYPQSDNDLATKKYVDDKTGQTTGTVTSVNNVSPDTNGNIALDTDAITEGSNNKYVTGSILIDIGTNTDQRHEHSNKTTLDAITAPFTTEEKTKLTGIADNANNYIHPLKHPPEIIETNSSYQFVSSTEKNTWSGKVDPSALDAYAKLNGDLTEDFNAKDLTTDKLETTSTGIDVNGGIDFNSEGIGLVSASSTGSAIASVSTTGGTGGYGGYSIDGKVAFVWRESDNVWGIYDTINYKWIMLGNLLGGVKLDYNGSTKLETTSTGIDVNGGIGLDSTYNIHPVADDGGSFGSVSVTGRSGGYAGYNIEGRVVFMHDLANQWHIYDDVNHQRMVYGNLGGEVALHYAGSRKLETTPTGIGVTGEIIADSLDLGGVGYGLGPVTGSLGSVQTIGAKSNTYGGFNIDGRVVFMHYLTGSTWGIYDDLNSDWLIQGSLLGGMGLYYIGVKKIETTSTGATVYGTINETSDINLKENVIPCPYGLEEIVKLNPIKYNFKDDLADNKNLGLSAQDVKEVIPELVEEGENLSLHYTGLIAPLINAVKELNATVNKQNTIIEELTQRLTKLEEQQK